MTIGIYCIVHNDSQKRYVGKSVNIERRLISHKCNLTSSNYKPKHSNIHLYRSVQKYGWGAFSTYILQRFNEVDEKVISNAELFWMDHFNSCNSSNGFNLRRDSSTGMVVHSTTRLKMSLRKGSLNSNYGNNWTSDQKSKMSLIAKERHKSGNYYGDNWRKQVSVRTSEFWKNNPDVKKQMAKRLSLKKHKYNIEQLTKEGEFIRLWESVGEIIKCNKDFKWQNIYSVCNGYKPSYMNFKWVKVLK